MSLRGYKFFKSKFSVDTITSPSVKKHTHPNKKTHILKFSKKFVPEYIQENFGTLSKNSLK